MKILPLLLLCIPCFGQSATTVPQTVTTTAPVTKAQTITITTSRNGGKVSFTIPAQTLAPLTATVPGQTAPVSLSGFNAGFACQISKTGSFFSNPDGTFTVTGLVCTLTKQ